MRSFAFFLLIVYILAYRRCLIGRYFFMDQTNKYIFTKEGFEKLLVEEKELKGKRRPGAVDRLKKAREMGDLSENSAYTAAKDELGFVDSRLAEIEELVKKAQIIKKGVDRSRVELGEMVVIEVDDQRQTFTIVGELEANIEEGKLSNKSPLGAALLGKHRGDMVAVMTPGGKTKYKIVDIK